LSERGYFANQAFRAYSAVTIKSCFGFVFWVFGIGGLLIELFKTQIWDFRYVQVAISLVFIVGGILIP